MPNYKQKLTNPLTNEDFLEGMKQGKFVIVPDHIGLVAFLHYSALRISEALNLHKEQFRLVKRKIYVDVGERLKHSKMTPPLPLSLEAPHMDAVLETVEQAEDGSLVWPYCRKTGYNIVNRVFAYPHYHRLSRITQFFLDGYTIAEVRSWTGLSLKALDYYVGLVSIEKMGESLAPKRLG